MAILHTSQPHEPWNKGKLIGQKAPLKLKDIWAIRIRLQLGRKIRDLALFNLAIDSKLRACDLVKLRVSRKLPRQADTSKIELPAWVVRYSAGLSPPSESCGRISL